MKTDGSDPWSLAAPPAVIVWGAGAASAAPAPRCRTLLGVGRILLMWLRLTGAGA